jgi:FtsH-binding integral membrane protein
MDEEEKKDRQEAFVYSAISLLCLVLTVLFSVIYAFSKIKIFYRFMGLPVIPMYVFSILGFIKKRTALSVIVFVINIVIILCCIGYTGYMVYKILTFKGFPDGYFM